MKKIKRKTILPVCCLLLAAVLGGCADKDVSHGDAPAETETAAAGETAAEKAWEAYREILKAAPAIEGEHPELSDASFNEEQNLKLFGNHYDLYALCDINQDEVPELLALSTVNFRWTQLSVYTYADGEAVLLKDPEAAETGCTFNLMSTANGSCFTYICEENHIHNVWRGSTPVGELEEDRAYASDGTAMVAVDCTSGETENAIYFANIAVENTAENVAMMP